MNKESKILHDAREKIGLVIDKWYGSVLSTESKYEHFSAEHEILALSGTTDIECPECKGSGYGERVYVSRSRYEYRPCPNCDNGVIKHKWKVSVTLENGELPENIYKNHDWAEALHVYHATQQDMLNAGYVQKVGG